MSVIIIKPKQSIDTKKKYSVNAKSTWGAPSLLYLSDRVQEKVRIFILVKNGVLQLCKVVTVNQYEGKLQCTLKVLLYLNDRIQEKVRIFILIKNSILKVCVVITVNRYEGKTQCTRKIDLWWCSIIAVFKRQSSGES